MPLTGAVRRTSPGTVPAQGNPAPAGPVRQLEASENADLLRGVTNFPRNLRVIGRLLSLYR